MEGLKGLVGWDVGGLRRRLGGWWHKHNFAVSFVRHVSRTQCIVRSTIGTTLASMNVLQLTLCAILMVSESSASIIYKYGVD